VIGVKRIRMITVIKVSVNGKEVNVIIRSVKFPKINVAAGVVKAATPGNLRN